MLVLQIFWMLVCLAFGWHLPRIADFSKALAIFLLVFVIVVGSFIGVPFL